MSGGANEFAVKYSAREVRPVAEYVVGDLSDLCATIEIAGSLRRGKPYVGDVEIVALPKRASELLARLDTWVATGKAWKAIYSNGTTRWGEKYRGLRLARSEFTVELFLADADNWGYVYWLRTGPGDANAYVMQQCIARHSPYRAVEGYWREVESGRRLRVAEEAELFRLLGMAYVYPKDRTLDDYQRRMNCRWVKDYTLVEDDSAPTLAQGSLF